MFLTQFFSLLETLKKLHHLQSFNEPDFNDLFNKLRAQYTVLGDIAQTNKLSVALQNHLLNAGGATLALICGITGGLIGGFMGLARGIWNYQPLQGGVVGLFAGVLMGAMLGFRTPKKLFKEEVQRQLKFGLDGMQDCFNEMQKEVAGSAFFDQKVKPIVVYQREVSAEIRRLFASQEAYEHFLVSRVDYAIDTIVATFIDSPMLAGYLGHHSYIKININEAQYLVEFAPDPSDLSKPTSQSEKRVASGKQLIEMLAYHRKLQETHVCDTSYLVTKIKPGETDCLSYVNKVLIGTNQEPTQVKRFVALNVVGTTYGAALEKLSPFAPGFFHSKKGADAGVAALSEGAAPSL